MSTFKKTKHGNHQIRVTEEEHRAVMALRDGAEAPEDRPPSAHELARIRALQSQIKELTETSIATEVLKAVFTRAVEAHDQQPIIKDTSWLNEQRDHSGMFSGIPSLMLSDLHFGEVVTAAEVNYVNSYNTETAKTRLARVLTSTLAILDQFKDAEYDGFCLILAGDLISGVLHDLPEFNDETPTQSIVTVTDCLITVIDKLVERFGRVFIPCVVGNHDRVSYRRTKTKGAVHDSFAWVIYRLLERHYATSPDVSFEISDSHALVYQINGRTYLLSHGDDIKGGNSAISGVLTAFTLATMRKVKQWAGHGIKVDTCLWGHFHTLSWGHRYGYISNGSLIGVGEYSLKANMGYEPPMQALWITAPNKQIVASFEVYADQVHTTGKVQWAAVPSKQQNVE